MTTQRNLSPTTELVITAEQTQAVLSYLLKCPCGDVYALVNILMALPTIGETLNKPGPGDTDGPARA